MNENDFDDDLRQILVCTAGEDCAQASKEAFGSATALYDALKEARNELGLRRKVYVIRSSCQGWCEYAPVCTVLPEGRVLSGLKPEEAEATIGQVLKRKEDSLDTKLIWDFSKSRSENLERKGKQRAK